MGRDGVYRVQVPDHVADDSLDDYVTELIIEEARMKDPAYQREHRSYVHAHSRNSVR